VATSINKAALAMTAIILSASIGAGGGALWSSRNQAKALQDMQAAGELLRGHMTADMAHDAIHADVLGMISGTDDGESAKQAAQDLAGHIAQLRKNIAADQAYAGSSEVSNAAGAIVGEVDKYAAAAEKVRDLSATDHAAAVAALPPFLQQFHQLEGSMDKVSDTISAHADDVKSRAASTAAAGFWIILGGMLISIVAVVFAALVTRRFLVKPLIELGTAVTRMSQGDMSAQIDCAGRQDELGSLAKATLRFRDQLVAADKAKEEQTNLIVSSIGAGLDRLAQGDLTARVEAELTGPFGKLKADFNNAMDEMSRTLGAVSQATGGVHTGAGEISQASNDLSRRTEQQAASLEETAAAMDEITATVREAAQNAARANKATAQARSEAEQSGAVVSRAIEAMSGIERSSAEISEIISVIDGIAFQTNLLALNAGVEAARAGDAGKGFAVVASEVRALAQRSAEAARDVKERITASSQQVEAGVSLVGETGAALNRIIGAVAEVDGLVADITTAAEQQAAGLQQVNTAVAEMDGVTQQNAAMVEEATAASRSLAAEADQLARHIGRFKLNADPVAAAPSNPVHKLQARAGAAARTSRPATRGNTALAVTPEDWSEF